jgi:TonB family protein
MSSRKCQSGKNGKVFMKMIKRARTAIILSVAIHIIAFTFFTIVKVYNTNISIKDKIPVSFVNIKNTKFLRRTNPTRRMTLFDKPIQNQFQNQAIIRPSYTSSETYYIDMPNITEQKISMYGSMKREGLKVPYIAQPSSVKIFPQRMLKMKTIELREINPPSMQIQPHISSGFDFLDEVIPVQAKPSLTDLLQIYTRTVRMKIESQKRYPLTARRAMIEGRVGIKMTILKDGQLEKVEIIEPSGYDILDKSALESIQNSAPFPQLPKDIERKRIQINIYLTYKIE